MFISDIDTAIAANEIVKISRMVPKEGPGILNLLWVIAFQTKYPRKKPYPQRANENASLESR